MVIYVVLNEGEIVFASEDEELANGYADKSWQKDIQDTANEYGFDLNNPKQLDAAQYQAGFDGGVYDVVKVDTNKFDDNDEMTVQLSVGEEVIERYDLERFL
jgi:hypothetical protein